MQPLFITEAPIDASPEDIYDEIVRMASEHCATPLALISLVDALLRKLHEREGAIRREHEILVRRQRQKDELVTLVIHDLKSPLASLLPNARFIVEEPSIPDDTRDAANDIIEAAESMNRMVMDLLDISRRDDGSFALRIGDIDVNALLEDVQGPAARRARDAGISIHVSPADKARTLRADRELLRRVLENLVDNAIKYSPAGGAIRVEVRSQKDAIELRVLDEGPGIPAASRQKIFQKYMQLDRDVLAHARAGRGLGLTFCQIAVEAHGGTIWVEDNVPQGSVFCVRLPLELEGALD